ncbi:MAG TPA: hydroxymethylbilane synthase, partial [Gemmatimonadales bacterium]|nr:hydroxymethylbilane synthase [Gemmatimonadales bacterium]
MTSVVGAIRLGTRASRLARIQTDLVRKALARLDPTIEFRSVEITTEGDRDLRTPLPEIGGKGVFTQELEQALQDGTIDLAVHSLKDVPVEPSPGLTLAAIGMREDPREVLIAAQGWTLATLPAGAKVGTCSTRRAAQLLVHRPDLQLAPLRGNVDTRVAKAQAGEFDAIVIAAAGVHRLGLASAITEYLPLEIMLPAPGQGALAVQSRNDDSAMLELLRGLEDTAARVATDAERAFLEGLGGGCAAPIAAFGEVVGGRLHLRGLVLSLDG